MMFDNDIVYGGSAPVNLNEHVDKIEALKEREIDYSQFSVQEKENNDVYEITFACDLIEDGNMFCYQFTILNSEVVEDDVDILYQGDDPNFLHRYKEFLYQFKLMTNNEIVDEFMKWFTSDEHISYIVLHAI